MCGISGLYSEKGAMAFEENLKASLRAIAKRGPDNQSYEIIGKYGLAHARLSIIDLSSEANQPMHFSAAKLSIIFNGEIYNYKELRRELKNEGIQFQTQSDTEVLLKGYAHYGTSFFEKLNGMFAFAIVDKEKDELILCRDRYGIKPLFYSELNGDVFYASELEALLAYPIPRKINFDALQSYLQLSYTPFFDTIVKNVRKVKPGHFIRLSKTNLSEEPYYTHKENILDIHLTEAQSEIRRLLDKSVERRLVSDVSISTFLSGGLDSSIITQIASEKEPNISSFSASFPDSPYYDESNDAEKWANKLGIKHQKIALKEDDIANSIEGYLSTLSEPFADASALAMYSLSKEVRKHGKVILSGDGADELFGGYRKHKAEWMYRKYGKYSNILPQKWLNALPEGAYSSRFGNIKRQINKWSKASELSDGKRYLAWASIQSEQNSNSLINRAGNFNFEPSITSFNDVLKMDMDMVLEGDMLVKVDRMSMHSALEIRVPFLDHELVDFVRSLPSDWKLKGGKRKYLLASSYSETIPSSIRNARKRGFEVPLGQWFKGGWNGGVEQNIDLKKISEQGIFNAHEVKKIKEKALSLNPGMAVQQLWAIIVFEHWSKRLNLQA